MTDQEKEKYGFHICSGVVFYCTLAYTVMFVSFEAIPVAMGWFGVVASIVYCLGNGIKLVETEFKSLWSIGELLILIFELVLGEYLLFSQIL